MKRLWLFAIGIAVAGLGAWWWTVVGEPWSAPPSQVAQQSGIDNALGATAVPAAGTGLPPSKSQPRAVMLESPVANGTSAAARQASAFQLPPDDLPLRDSAVALIEAHRAGHLPATKRLLKELADCQRQRWASLRMDMMIAFEDSPRARRGGERMQDAISKAAETVAELAELCADLPADMDEALLFEVQRRAADAGDLAGQLTFALVPALTLSKALQQMDRLSAYQELAPQFLQRALQQGSGQAVAGFMDNYEYIFEGWRGHEGGSSMQVQAMRKMMQTVRPLNPLQQVLGEDLNKAYSYALLCKRVCSGNDVMRAESAVTRLAISIEPDARRQAQNDADTLYDAHFATRPRPPEVDLQAMRDAVLGFRR